MKRRARKVKRSAGPITVVLSKVEHPESLKTVMELAYEELHGIAVAERRKWIAHSLQPTELLSETYIRLLKNKKGFKNRRYFFASAAKAMRRILVDQARRSRAQMRWGHLDRVDFTYAQQIGFEEPAMLLEFHAALERLEKENSDWSDIVELRVFGGYSVAELAFILDCSESAVRVALANAKTWLIKKLGP